MRFSMEQIFRDINTLLQWSKLKALQQNKLVKTSYIWILIVPFLSKFFSKISDNLVFNIQGKVYELDLILPFSWKIFFISALLFTFANMLFYLFAPRIVKEYEGYGDFEAQGKTYKKLEDYFSSHEHSKSMGRIYCNEGEKPLDELFWEIYEDRDKNTHSLVRYFASLLYLIGLVLSGYIFIQSIWWVISSWL